MLPLLCTALTIICDELAPELEAPLAVVTPQGPVEVRGQAAPLLADWDSDGRLDLLVGQFEGGALQLFGGTESGRPREFEDATWVEAEGIRVKVPFE